MKSTLTGCSGPGVQSKCESVKSFRNKQQSGSLSHVHGNTRFCFKSQRSTPKHQNNLVVCVYFIASTIGKIIQWKTETPLVEKKNQNQALKAESTPLRSIEACCGAWKLDSKHPTNLTTNTKCARLWKLTCIHYLVCSKTYHKSFMVHTCVLRNTWLRARNPFKSLAKIYAWTHLVFCFLSILCLHSRPRKTPES
jgi:hypothetical protein